ncbi:MAG: hypothetical protein ALECFALPRED_004955 [Alectoria fallacina]|uniref:Uncharacterized protein n=1 Tax=Alectoria fallacina TaxID=1903189 RepID=A0A8H3FS40_9LECA|nr:MAG: hypothetical protein ALECFALPRED_004955 [Alectoria fallacina]
MTAGFDVPRDYANLNEIEAPPPVQNTGIEHAAQRAGQVNGSDPNTEQSKKPVGENYSSSQQYDIPGEYANLDELAGPLPVENPHEGLYQHHDLEEVRINEQEDRQRVPVQSNEEDEDDSHEYANLDELEGPPPSENPDERQVYRHHDLEEARTHEQQYEQRVSRQGQSGQPSTDEEKESPRKTRERKLHRMNFHLYVTAYLILFSILGTLARLGLQALTIYPGSPIAISELWANVGGCLIMGYLSEDRTLFHNEFQNSQKRARQKLQRERENSEATTKEAVDEEAILAAARKEHQTEKKTIPIFIGLTVGFCGCFTSFSSFMRDVFFALSNHLDTSAYTDNTTVIGTMVPRDDGNSVMAVLAVLVVEICLCLSAQAFGAHIAIALEPVMSKVPRLNARRIMDPIVVFIAWGSWVGAVVMVIWPPDRPSGPAADRQTSWAQETWRGDALFALALAPLGCLLRFHAALKFNGLISYFPVGTFVVNVAGTMVLGACWDLQRAPLTNGAIGGGRIGCQALQGVQDGFCGCLTTVSTWVVELKGLRRKHAYFYGATSVAFGVSSLVVIMGTFVWEQGNRPQACSV